MLVDYIYALLFLLFSIKVTQQPSIGLTNGDGSSTPEAAKSTSSDDTIFNDTPPISNKYDMPALEKTSSKTIGSYKFWIQSAFVRIDLSLYRTYVPYGPNTYNT